MKYFLFIFFAVATVQLYIPVRMVLRKRAVIENGKDFKFIAEPVDPTHPFKGKYLTIRYTSEHIRGDSALQLPGYEVFVVIKDSSGFAKVSSVATSEPSQENHYFKARISYHERSVNEVNLHVLFPFDEYYLDEYDASAAEEIYNQSIRDSSGVTYAVVTVGKGDAVLREIYMNDQPLKGLLRD